MSGSTTDFGDEGGARVRSSRVLAARHREEQDRQDALVRERERAHQARLAHNAAVLDDPEPAGDRDPAHDLTLLEAEACGFVTHEQLRTLEQCHGTPEHEVQRTRILEIAQERYNICRRDWPACAVGPLLPGPRGLLIPTELRGHERAVRVRVQLEQTAELRDLYPHERAALRALKRNGVRRPDSPADDAAIERARLKRLSKGAKRARAAQASMASARQRLETTAEPQEVAC